MVQFIWIEKSWISSYDVPNKGSKQSANNDTNKKIEIPFGIAFENWSNKFVKSWNLKHNKSLTSTIQCNMNFNISINWFKIIMHQTGPPRNMCKVQKHENSNWPTLRGLKPNQTDSKWLKIWNIGSQVRILGTPKFVGYDTFLGARYSKTNTTSCRCLTLVVKCRFDNFSK